MSDTHEELPILGHRYFSLRNWQVLVALRALALVLISTLETEDTGWDSSQPTLCIAELAAVPSWLPLDPTGHQEILRPQ